MKSSLVDVGEKKSSPNFGAPNVAMHPADVRLYCFPDIPMDAAAGDRDSVSQATCFKRVHFEQIESTGRQGHAPATDAAVAGPVDISAEEVHKNYQRGFEDGQQAFRELQQKEIGAVLASLQQALRGVNQLRKEMVRAAENEVVELALAIARKVVCREVIANKEAVLCVAREALNNVEVPGHITIKMNPSDLRFINESRDQLQDFLSHVENVTFCPEESISSGGCMIETDLGDIDARLEKQFGVVAEMLRTELLKPTAVDPETA